MKVNVAFKTMVTRIYKRQGKYFLSLFRVMSFMKIKKYL